MNTWEINNRFRLSHYSERLLPIRFTYNSPVHLFLLIEWRRNRQKMRIEKFTGSSTFSSLGRIELNDHLNENIPTFSHYLFFRKWIIHFAVPSVALFSFAQFIYDVCVFNIYVYARRSISILVIVVGAAVVVVIQIQIVQVQVHSYVITSICFEIYFHRLTFS